MKIFSRLSHNYGIGAGAAALLLPPIPGYSAFLQGDGSANDPISITQADSSLDGGSTHYLVDASIDFGATAPFFVGKNTKDNFLAIQGVGVTVRDYVGYIGYGAAGSGSVTVQDGAVWNNDSYLDVGCNGEGALNIYTGGSVTAKTGYIGYRTGSTGTVNISGIDSSLTAGELYIGDQGEGILNILDHGSAEVKGSCYLSCDASLVSTQLVVSGAQSEFSSTGNFIAGYYGMASVTVGAGASITSPTVDIAANTTASGSAFFVTGANSFVDSTYFIVGEYGKATLSVTDGAYISTKDLTIAEYESSGNSKVTVSGSQSGIAATGTITVGAFRPGELRVEKSAAVSCATVNIGYADAASSGKVVVTDSFSQLSCSGSMYVGGTSNGSGELRVENGSIVQCEDLYIGGISTGGPGSVTVSGAGSILFSNTSLSMGTAAEASITLSNRCMFMANNTVAAGSGATLYFANGAWAIKGEFTSADIIYAYKVKVFNGQAWVDATTSNLNATYFPTLNDWKSSPYYALYGALLDLNGYTLVTGGVSFVPWAGDSYTNGIWFKSPWYGWLSYEVSDKGWTYHSFHGWQYAYDLGGTDGIVVWDEGTACWWYTGVAFYPYMYNYKTSSWYYYYEGGMTPNRWFYDCKDKLAVKEAVEFQN